MSQPFPFLILLALIITPLHASTPPTSNRAAPSPVTAVTSLELTEEFPVLEWSAQNSGTSSLVCDATIVLTVPDQAPFEVESVHALVINPDHRLHLSTPMPQLNDWDLGDSSFEVEFSCVPSNSR